MPVGLVSDEDFELEHASIVDIQRPGRRNGDNNVPSSLRQVIAEEAIVNGNGSANELAELFGISKSSVSAYKNGATSTDSYNLPNPILADKVKTVKDKIRSKAQSKLIMALGEVTPDKLKSAKLRDIAATAQAMSAIVKNMDDNNGDSGRLNPANFIIYAPYIKNESDFRTVVINEVG
jgi:transcriptional regulator with XRE-family HTH domain